MSSDSQPSTSYALAAASPRRTAQSGVKTSTPRRTASRATGSASASRPSSVPEADSSMAPAQASSSSSTSRRRTSPRPSSSTSNAREARERAERNERAQLGLQTLEAQRDIARLHSEVERLRKKRARAAESVSLETSNEQLESALRDADDGALTALLTAAPSALLPLLHSSALADNSPDGWLQRPMQTAGGIAPPTDPTARLEAAREALAVQATFSGIELRRVESSEVSEQARELQLHLRRGSDKILLRLDIVDGRRGPSIRRMYATLPSALREVLLPHVDKWEESGDVPALLLALRTQAALAESRTALFDAVRSAHSSLRFKVKGSAGEELVMANTRGAQLSLHFNILFSPWGIASPSLSMLPHIPGLGDASESRTLIEALPERFMELIAAAEPGSRRVQQAVETLVGAFFGEEA